MNKSTSDLMATLNSVQGSHELDNYIRSLSDDTIQKTFAGYISYMINEKSLSRAEVISRSLISRTYGYQIFDGTRNANRDKIIALCISTGLTLEETTRGLEIAKEGILYPRDPRDAVIIYAINNKYTVRQLNSRLTENGFEELD
ncbi:MAG: hypothetical protein IKE53_03980 [Clostridiales bacterium]|nr:hypothetical protein [Clostridiales bacterium]